MYVAPCKADERQARSISKTTNIREDSNISVAGDGKAWVCRCACHNPVGSAAEVKLVVTDSPANRLGSSRRHKLHLRVAHKLHLAVERKLQRGDLDLSDTVASGGANRDNTTLLALVGGGRALLKVELGEGLWEKDNVTRARELAALPVVDVEPGQREQGLMSRA